MLDSVPTTEVVNVLTEVSHADRLGMTLGELMGVLRNPLSVENAEGLRPFGLMMAQILRKLGGEYERLAQELEQANRSDEV